MNKFSPPHLVVLINSMFACLAGAARADTVTSNVAPITYPDLNTTGNTDTLTGDFVISSTGAIEGTWSASNTSSYPIDVTADLTMTSAGPTAVAPVSVSASYTIDQLIASNWIQRAGLTISSSSVSLLNGSSAGNSGYLYLGVQPSNEYVSTTWDPLDGNVGDVYAAASSNSFNGATMQFEDQDGDAYPYSSQPSPWILATAVPEPGTLALIAITGLLGLDRRFLRRGKGATKTG
jgi:PEP-CTERM motif